MVAEMYYDYPVLTSKQAKVLRACRSTWCTPGEVSKELGSSVANVLGMLVALAASGYLNTSLAVSPGKTAYYISNKGYKVLDAHDAAVKVYRGK